MNNNKTRRGKTNPLALLIIFMLLAAGCGLPKFGEGKNEANSNVNSKTVVNSNPNAPVDKEKTKALRDKAEELANMSPPVELEDNPMIKGKVAIVQKTGPTANLEGLVDGEPSDVLLSGFGISETRIARSVEEIDTLIQIVGKDYSHLKISIIDYRKPAIIAQEENVEKLSIETLLQKFPLGKISNPVLSPSKVSSDKYSSFISFGKDLARVYFPVQINPNATIKGKVAITRDGNLEGFSSSDIYKYQFEDYGVPVDKIAFSPGEIDTYIRVSCKRGNQVGKIKRAIAYANQCEISVIDYKNSAIIAQRTFENNQIEKDDGEFLDAGDKEYTLPMPLEFRYYIKSLPKS